MISFACLFVPFKSTHLFAERRAVEPCQSHAVEPCQVGDQVWHQRCKGDDVRATVVPQHPLVAASLWSF